ncbi:MAG TPA: EAL domain-containing protein [Acetobacteraceae bacterium]|nr:EAL domain-containing protein [Acetobacteraceae bacterium]
MHPRDGCLLLPTGSLLFQEGDAGSAAYLIEAGQIEIFLRRDGQTRTLALRGPGEIVGEMAIIDGRPRSASARAAQDCALVPITAEQLAQRSLAADPILRMCLGVVIERCRESLAMLGSTPGSLAAVTPPEPATRLAGPVSGTAIEMLRLEREIQRALHRREFVLFFQPIVHLRSRRLAGFEALARWQHPERGLVSPGAFIPAAEAGGLIGELTAWCLAEVGRVLPEILAAASANSFAAKTLFVSVNISGHDLAQAGFSDSLHALLRTSGITPGTLKIEVTESTLMQDPKRASKTLDACRALGMGIAIDDFGTGYSSLSYLSTLPVTTLKVDRSFVQPMASNPTSRRIVQAILRLADELGISAVAEGIEHETEAGALAAMGCEYGQGYLFGRPAPLRRTLELIRGWSPRQAAPPRLAAMPTRALSLILDPA